MPHPLGVLDAEDDAAGGSGGAASNSPPRPRRAAAGSRSRETARPLFGVGWSDSAMSAPVLFTRPSAVSALGMLYPINGGKAGRGQVGRPDAGAPFMCVAALPSGCVRVLPFAAVHVRVRVCLCLCFSVC